MIEGEPDWFPLLDDNLKASGELKQIGQLHEQLQIHKPSPRRAHRGFST